jgi:hypothetical protein
VGQTGLCQKAPDAKGCFAREVVEAHLGQEVPGGSSEGGRTGEEWDLRWWKELQLSMDKEHTRIALGQVGELCWG